MFGTAAEAGAPASQGAVKRWGKAAALLALVASSCSARELKNPVRLTLTNRSGKTVTGVILRFDRELTRAERTSANGFISIKLRLAPSDTLRLEGGRLQPGGRTVYQVEGKDGPARPLDGRWLIDGRLGPLLTKDEFGVR